MVPGFRVRVLACVVFFSSFGQLVVASLKWLKCYLDKTCLNVSLVFKMCKSRKVCLLFLKFRSFAQELTFTTKQSHSQGLSKSSVLRLKSLTLPPLGDYRLCPLTDRQYWPLLLVLEAIKPGFIMSCSYIKSI